MKRLRLHIRTFFVIAWLSRGDGYSCPYGQNCVNTFEPAPPGRAPPCAQPGLTYCVHPDPYPEQIIRRLIEAGQYDISTLLSDESRDEFNSNKKTDYGYGYGPNSLPNVDQISIVNEPKHYNTKFHSRFNHEIFSQKTPLQPPSPVDPSPYNINAFQSSNYSKFGFQNPNYWSPSFDYENKINRPSNVYNQNFYNTPFNQYDSADWFRQAASGVTQYNHNEWWKYPSRAEVTVQRSITFPTRSTRHRRRRNAELVRASEQRQLTGTEALRIALGLARYPSRAEVTVQRSITFPTRSTRHRQRRNAELVRASEQRQLTGTEALSIALGLDRYPSRAEVTVQRSITFSTRSTRHRRRNNAELVRASEQRQLTGTEALRIALGLTRYPSRAQVTVQRSITFPTRSTRHRRRRNAELVRASEQRQLTGTEALRIALELDSAETSAERPRRQAPGTEELCRVRTDYITPRAALNNKGSWRYVVNMPNNMTQLVRAEICTSTQCSNLCSIPVGYSSRCEQKYIQKRLVALGASGQNLYTDVFWIPSCCQCTIIANNT